ncbi:MAG: hypothetical protein LC121_25435 [Anaerolineae bacterium]|jgi:hypothetical protein|nr:hypothetical protein [Anaerolineae bacterium]
MFDPANLPPPDENGLFLHPDIPDMKEGESMRALCAALGFDCSFIGLDDDAPRDLVDAYFEEGRSDVPARWTPTPPAGEGWLLVAKFDHEDGPYAMFVRRRP